MRPDPRLIPRLDVEFGLDDMLLYTRSSGHALEDVKRGMRGLFPEGGTLFVDSGRTALYLALKALRLEKEAKVGVPLYTCDVIFDAIVKAGCTPVFIDVDPETYTMDPRDLELKAKGLAAVIPVHTFGHPADMDEILAVAGKTKVVEDCVHGLGAKYKGKPVGSFGDACFYSFRSGKPLSAGNVGLLLCKEEDIFTRAGNIWREFPSYSRREQAVDSLKQFSRGMFYRPPWFGLFALPVGGVADSTLDFMGKAGFDPHKSSDGALEVVARRLENYPARLAKARENARMLVGALASSPAAPPIERNWAFHSYFLFAMRFRDRSARDAASTYLAKHGVDSIKFYADVPNIAPGYGYGGDCPVSETAASTVLTVPGHGRLTRQQITKVAAALRGLGETR